MEALRRILFLQGPVGPFIKLLSQHLIKTKKVIAHQITFNGGDDWFANKNIATPYTGKPKEWNSYLSAFVDKHNITDVIVFGDCRFYHREAKKVVERKKLSFWAFEEGYLRPSYITLEKEGVNGNSLFDAEVLQSFEANSKSEVQPLQLKHTYINMAYWASAYYFFKSIFSFKYKHYIHHRPWEESEELYSWMMSGAKKLKYKNNDAKLLSAVKNELSGQYFLAPLQVSVDSQILFHSPFRSVEEFIGVVVKSFAHNANEGDYLILKHHPMDRGFVNYTKYIKKLSYAYDVVDRVIYCHDTHLPTLLKNAKGTITVNSTVGISSLHHSTPTKVMGKAIYDINGVTSQKSLDDFWQSCCKPCPTTFAKFKAFLLEKSQIPGSFYRNPNITLHAVTEKMFNQ
ncbi:capsule biosynthesis protein [Flocculibacter collagenilyticus]|uniref:capsule biosynthesis protein n=1 Tax=Flocculibacter collagenilyticus TaxID=2744479 RepID=UPI0018F63444|nr:capsular biosynthesis protein [Flocculibacter collagenilyticus]